MITINLVPKARRRRQTQLSREDKTLIFVAAAVLVVLALSYGYARFLVYRTTAHLADLNAQITALDSEQKLLDLNRSLAQRSLAMETNIATAVQLQINTNQVLDDLAKDLPKACTLTQTDITVLPGTIKVAATSAQFIDLVRFFNALSADAKFKGVHIDGYQIPYSTGVVQQGLQAKATMNISLTWVGGGANG
jgi:Tfp pilus assembly protein PilN